MQKNDTVFDYIIDYKSASLNLINMQENAPNDPN